MEKVIGLLRVLMCVYSCLRVTHAHSWIACTDYLENNGEYWDGGKCRAFPRHGHQFTPKTSFGQDTGYNIINPPDNAPCRTTRDDNGAYTNDYPMAVYYVGQRVVLAHPTKNHVADVGCTNKYIPDNGNFIWSGPVNGQSDPSLTVFRSSVVADLGVAPNGHTTPDAVTQMYPKPGYQNAPKFCENTDKALATNMFQVPSDMQTGRYTLMWGWLFNSVNDLYTSCWEVDIVATKAERDNRYLALGLSTADAQNVGDGDMPTPAPTMGPTNPPTQPPTPAPTGGQNPPAGQPTGAPCDCSQCQTAAASAVHLSTAALSAMLATLLYNYCM